MTPDQPDPDYIEPYDHERDEAPEGNSLRDCTGEDEQDG